MSLTYGSPQSLPGNRVIRLYNLYRVAVGLALVLLISSPLDNTLLEVIDAALFRYGSWAYLGCNILLAVLVQRPWHLGQVFALALCDTLLLCLLFFAAGGTVSGIGNLLIVSVAIANILLHGRIGLVIAAVAALGMLSLTFYISLLQPGASAQIVQAGVLGALCFAAALLLQRWTRRLRISEQLASQRARDVASLEELNSLILQRMRTGILVLDERQQVLLANPASLVMLGQSQLQQRLLRPHCPPLVDALQHWQGNPTLRPLTLRPLADGPVLQPSFVPLQHGGASHTLVFLDDVSQLAQQAQQLKLASLGRLTAGIAHEIRNPLGAISHAAQLLHESEALDGADRRLAQIIQDHSRRMNIIIENVLQLSRRNPAQPQLLDLKYWLHRFAGEFRQSSNGNQQLHLECQGSNLQTRMDPHQLTQVLNNLVQNGLRYSARKNGNGQVWLKLQRDPHSELPVLEVQDDGPGIGSEQQQHLFEPFHTTDTKGTGLGLYISRELCESNQARLDYKLRDGGGSCFRITFAHPRKLS